jgi:hypothetical protein
VRALRYLALLLVACSAEDDSMQRHIQYDRDPWSSFSPEQRNNPNWGFSKTFDTTLPPLGTEIPLNRLSGEPPITHAVMLGLTANVGATNADLRAKVTFGIGAFTQVLLCDFANGSQFSLVASNIQVSAIPWLPAVGGGYNPTLSSPAIIGAGIVRGELTNTFPLTFTETTRTISAVTAYTRPQFGQRVRIYTAGSVAALAWTVSLESSGGASYGFLDAVQFASGAAVMLPGAADQITITPNVGPQTFCVQWELSI